MSDERERPWVNIGRFLRRVPRQDRARSVVDAILEAAEERIDSAERGPLKPLLARAGVAAGSFYEYFASREALLAAVIERLTDRNFSSFLDEIDAATAGDRDFEDAVRHSADVVVRHYLRRPRHLQAVIRLADRLGLLSHIGRERDRFADALAVRVQRFVPEMPPAACATMMRAASDALTGIVVVSLFRPSPAPLDDVVRLAGDVGWGVIQAHLQRARATAHLEIGKGAGGSTS